MQAMRRAAALFAIAAALVGGGAYAEVPPKPGAPAAPDASARPKRLAIYTEGEAADAIRSELIEAMPERFRLVDNNAFREALIDAGQRGPFGPTLADPKRRERSLAKIRKAAAAVSADAVLVARGRRDGWSTKVRLMYVDQIGGDLAVDEEVKVDAETRGKRSALFQPFAAQLEELSPSAPPAPPPAPPPPPPPEPPKRAPNDVASALVIGAIGIDVGGRWFRYEAGKTTNLRPYSFFGAAMPRAAVEVYPLARTSIPVARDLGITLAYARALGISSTLPGRSAPIGTSWDRLDASLRFRLRTGDAPLPLVGIAAGAGFDRFTFAAKSPVADELPDTSYVYLRIGADARVPIWRFGILARLSYVGPLAGGEVFQRFRAAKLAGVEMGGGLAARIALGFEARVEVEYTRFLASFDARGTDAYVAAGAHDDLVALRFAAAYVY
jgi:hypothetical protein